MKISLTEEEDRANDGRRWPVYLFRVAYSAVITLLVMLILPLVLGL